MSVVTFSDCAKWTTLFDLNEQENTINMLERGDVLFFPKLNFFLEPNEEQFLSAQWSDNKAKNISFDLTHSALKGVKGTPDTLVILAAMMKRYAEITRLLSNQLFPLYRGHLIIGRTSFRPVEIAGRQSPSYKKDDTRLHIDAFPSRPTGGSRILRIFTNVNPKGDARIWRLGEPFTNFARQFITQVRPPIPGISKLLSWLRITKGQRAPYDHYMLRLHNLVKANSDYQKKAPQDVFEFPAHSTWIAYTDQVLHAATAGQYVLEQTYYVPTVVLKYPQYAPLYVLQRLTGRVLTRQLRETSR